MSDYFFILPCMGYFQVGMSLIHANVKNNTCSFYLISFYISYHVLLQIGNNSAHAYEFLCIIKIFHWLSPSFNLRHKMYDSGSLQETAGQVQTGQARKY